MDVKVEINIDVSCVVPKVVVYTREVNDEINELVRYISEVEPTQLLGYRDDHIELIQPENILRVYAERHKVFVQTERGDFTVRCRLYEMEQRLFQSWFIRVSNSEIINFKQVEHLDLSYNGTICLKLRNGATSFVSRRYLTKIKQYLGL